MTITPTALMRAAAIAAAAAGAVFIGVQINHPYLDVTSVTGTEMLIRDSLKVLMGVLALIGVAGLYLRQVRAAGVLGLIGYVLLSAGYLLITCTSFVAAFVLPAIAGTDPAYTGDVLDAATNRTLTGDIGPLAGLITAQGIAYLAGGLIFGIALFRARVLTRWATVLLAAGGALSAALNVMPDAFYRLLAFPNGIAMIALGWSLWRSVAVRPEQEPALTTAGAA